MTGSPLAPATFTLLLDLLRHTFGSQVELSAYTIVNQRQDYVVLLADLLHPPLRVSIKLAGPQASTVYPFDRTAMLHKLVQERTTIPMADIIAVDTNYNPWPWQYLIKTYIEGEEWAQVRHQLSQPELRTAYEQLGDSIAQMHLIRFSQFGELTAQGEVEAGTDLLAALINRAQHTIRSSRLRNRFLTVLEQQAGLFSNIQPASLCHDDLHGHNILFQQQQGQWRMATILDLDKGWAGHHETDLARLDLWTGMTGDGFWAAYESILPVTKLYHQRRPVYQLLWCLEYAVSTPKHLADTAQVCQQLGVPVLERFE